MRKFLSQFMSADKIDEIEKAFKEKNADSTGLPTYIAKSRFDEVNGKLKAAEDIAKNFDGEKAKAVKEALSPLEAKLKEIPEDWKVQLEAATKAVADTKTEYEGKLTEATKNADVTAKIYESGARNAKAVKALLDGTKPIEEQLTKIKETDPYLFGGSGLGKGTGKGDGEHGGDGDDKGKDGESISTARMYEAVGLTPPSTEK